MARIYNKSKEQFEPAKWQKCPRCKGYGANFGDEHSCPICNGFGEVWMAKSGWTRAKYAQMEKSKLY